MIAQNLLTARTSVALTKETNASLKRLTKESGSNLKIYEMITALVELASSDPSVLQRAIEIGESKIVTKVKFSQTVSKLPVELRDKLKKMSTVELAALLAKAGLSS